MRRILEMGFIWLLIAAICALFLSSSKISKEHQRKISMLLCVLVPILASIREVGLDIPNYETIYSLYLYPFFSTSFDGLDSLFSYSYEPLNYILAGLFGPDGFRFYLYIITQFTFLAVYYLVRRRNNPLLYICPFVLFNLFYIDQSRQFFAEGFILWSLPIQNTFAALLVALCSGLAHFGIVPASLLTIFRNIKFSQVSILFTGVAFLLCCALGVSLIDSLSDSVDSTFLSSRLSSYSVGSFFSATNVIRLINVFFPSVSTIAFMLLNLKIFKIDVNDRVLASAKNNAILSIVLFVVVLVITRNDVFATRLFSALAIGNFLLVGNYVENNPTRAVMSSALLWLIAVNVIWSAYYFYIFTV